MIEAVVDALLDQSGAAMENNKGDNGGENDSGGCDEVNSAVQGLCRHRLCFDVTLYSAAFGRQVQQRASGSIRVDVSVEHR